MPPVSADLEAHKDESTNNSPTPDDFIGRWAVERFPLYTRACLVLAAFLVPITIRVGGGTDTFSLIKLGVLWFLGTLASLFWVVRAQEQRQRLPRIRIGYAAIAFLISYGIATFFSLAPQLSLLGRSGRFGGLIPLVLYVVIMYLVADTYARSPRKLEELFLATTVGSVIASGYILFQATGIDQRVGTSSPLNVSEFPYGTLGNSNFVGSYLVTVLPLSGYILYRQQHRWARAFAGIGCGLQVLAIWYSQTRGALVAAGFAAVVMVVLSRRQLSQWAKRGLVGIGAAAVILLILVVWHPGTSAPIGPLGRLRTSTSTLENRLYYWEAALQIFRDHPVTGTGPDTFYAYYSRYRPQAEALKNGFVLTDKPHNVFLERATDAGAPGLLSYLAVISLGFVFCVRSIRNRKCSHRPILICLIGAFTAYIVQSIFSIDVPSSGFLPWVLLGAIAALADPGTREPKTARDGASYPHRSPWRRWMLRATTMAVGAALLFLGSFPIRASVAMADGRPVDAMRLLPTEADYPSRACFREGSIALATRRPDDRLRRLERAERYCLRARRLQPGNYNYTMQVAVVNTYWAQRLDPSRFAVAEMWWRRAVAEDRHGPGMRARYATALDEMRNRAGELQGLAESHRDDAAAWLQASKAHAVLGATGRARVAAEHALRISPENRQAKDLLATLPP